jgi:hypothetical protein
LEEEGEVEEGEEEEIKFATWLSYFLLFLLLLHHWKVLQ